MTYFDVKHTLSAVKVLIDNHLESDSLLAIKDILLEYGLESVALRKGKYSYSEFKTPFVCSIQKEEWSQPLFILVTKNDDGNISFLDPIKNKLTSL